jgi:translation elongation factor EF-G
MLVEITAPEEFQSIVLGNINKRHGVILSTETNQGWFNMQCEVALNDMFGYCKLVYLNFLLKILILSKNFKSF